MEKAKAILIIAAVFVVGLVFIFMPDKAKNYQDNGIKAEVTITSVYGLKTKQYTGVYTDENGNIIEAKVIPNRSGVYTGDVLVGYYMPDNPSNVICGGGSGIIVVVRIIGVLLCLFGGFMVYSAVRTNSEES